MPWIYEKEKPDVQMNSPYNRKPKGSGAERDYEVKLATIRKALSTQDDRWEKIRAERNLHRPWIGYDRVIAGTFKGLASGEGDSKKGAKSAAAAKRAAEKAELKELGIKVGGKKTGSKAGMTSKGGNISKKEREVLNMAKGHIGFEFVGVKQEQPQEKEEAGGKKKGEKGPRKQPKAKEEKKE